MKPAMSTLDEQDIVLLQRIKRHPLLRARVESLLGVVEDAEGDLEKADAAERRVIEELRQMGNEVLTEWAQGGIEKSAAQARAAADVRSGGKKTPLAYDFRRNHGRGAVVSAGHASRTALPRTGGGELPGDVSAVAAGVG
jgi:endonuclease/exonuclease/phosphatase family metal-dependent hydrolase